MTVSIIIATKIWQRHLQECIDKCFKLDYPDFEIIVLPDYQGRNISDQRIKVIATGPVGPARKRDMAINSAKGEILAFIDDDAYPEKDWLKNAVKNFSVSDIAAIGGPAVTAQNDDLRQRASGLVYTSPLVSGKNAYRYLPKKRIEVEDYPSCNFLVRKSIIQQLGGFNTDFWPGEDTKLCLDITQKLNKKIIYDPSVLVYHHRRPLFLAHLRQIASYALHRGYFAKRYPGTSFKLSYFVPTLFLLAIVIGATLSVFLTNFRIVYLSGLFLYLLLICIATCNKQLRIIPLVFLGIIFTHFTYGLYFIKGLLSNRLAEECQKTQK